MEISLIGSGWKENGRSISKDDEKKKLFWAWNFIILDFDVAKVFNVYMGFYVNERISCSLDIVFLCVYIWEFVKCFEYLNKK